MKIHPIPLTILLCIVSITLYSQKESDYTIRLRNEKFVPQKNISAERIEQFNKDLQRLNGKGVCVIQFDKIPGDSQKRILAASGIKLQDYITGQSYITTINGNVEYAVLKQAGARAIFELSANQKMHPAMAEGRFPPWAEKTPGMVDLWISVPSAFTTEEIVSKLAQENVLITDRKFSEYHILGIRIAKYRIHDLIAQPFITYTEPVPHENQVLNLENRNSSKGHILNTSISSGGYGLDGQGVVIGVGDDADPAYHVDFSDRIINFGPAGYAYHGTHVHGTVGGAGNRLEGYSGFAPKSTLITQYLSGILNNTSNYVSDYGMVLTNNSYGGIGGDCDYMGYYDLLSRIMDLHASAFPNLQHVFAAGNDGSLTCSPFPAYFRTVLSSYQSAKNIISVGATNRDGSVASFSGRGPVQDGRTKPEIMADGVATISTTPDDSYNYSSGTSMSSPAVVGGMALLYERYRQLNSGTNPANGLMKALICNGGKDAGNKGPDFTYGYGNLDLFRSIEMLNNNQYFIASAVNGNNNNHTITVPAGIATLRVFLYWNDPAALPLAESTLVNDLDLEVVTPASSTVLPYVLDASPANVNSPAIQAADHINNGEQVVIDNPASGSYTLTVKGFNIPSGPQQYFLVYDFIPAETKITYPVGGEKLNPTENIIIQWDSYGDPANTFTIDYSDDDGMNWTTINSAIPSNQRRINWTVPAVVSDKARIRVSRNGTGFSDTSNAFVILGVPTLNVSSTQCEGYFAFNWTAVPGATDYEIFQLQGAEMVSIGTTTATNYTLSGLNSTIEYLVSVAARFNGTRGRRALSIKRIPGSGTCTGSISDNDIKMDSIVAPVYGRIGTSSELGSSTQVRARIKNLDDANVTSFDIRYSVNGGPWFTESVSTTINAGATYTHTFSASYDFTVPGDYILAVEVLNTTNGPGSDLVTANNMITDTIRQLNNLPISLPFIDDLETAEQKKYYKKQFGLFGAERYDYSNTYVQGRLSTFIISGMSYSGSRSLIMDLDGYNGTTGNTNYAYGTFNLSGHDALTEDLRLDMQFKIHGDSVSHPDNRIWVRGDDTSNWIEAFVLSDNENEAGVFKKTPSIEISNLLLDSSQNFSSSFQIRLGQFGRVRVSDNKGIQGHNFDDIRIYAAVNDLQIVRIDTPVTSKLCGLGNMPVKVTIRNASPSTLNNIPVVLVVDGNAPITEIIPTIASRTTIEYTFATAANLSVLGDHVITAYTNFATDNLRENDTARVSVTNLPIINTYPYLENFENNNGYWFTEGKNSSWEYGTPASPKLDKAASGSKAWKTSLTGNYNNDEYSFLSSPCFDLSGLTNPTLSFSIALDLEDCGSVFCDGAYVEYSTDGLNWQRLGDASSGTNWYNRNYTNNPVWSIQNNMYWHVVTTALPAGVNNLKLRIVMESDPFVSFEGISIDDIHIYDNTMEIYDGITMTSPVSQSISAGNNWVNISSNNQLLASVLPGTNNLGSTSAQAFINTGPMRSINDQYYLNRNLVIRPSVTEFDDSVLVRIYFLDTESQAIRQANTCATCTNPQDAYSLGITKYHEEDGVNENGTPVDDTVGNWHFVLPENVAVVPYLKGYYAEFKTKDFSELWLNDGGIDKVYSLRTEFLELSATLASGNVVDLAWKVKTEYNVVKYEIQVARDEAAFQALQFSTIGEVNGGGVSPTEQNYSFSDTENNKSGVRYYRIKVIYADDKYTYSEIKSVLFYEGFTIRVYPNPSSGTFILAYQLTAGEEFIMNIYSMDGRLMHTEKIIANGYPELKTLDLSNKIYADGMYLLRFFSEDENKMIKIVKHR